MQADLDDVQCYIPVVGHALRKVGISISQSALSRVTALEKDNPYWVHKPEMEMLELLEALREISTTYTNTTALVESHVVELMHACRQFPCEAVRVMADEALEGWRRIALVRIRALIGVPCAVIVEVKFTIRAFCLLSPLSRVSRLCTWHHSMEHHRPR
jgi:hypothetical protein